MSRRIASFIPTKNAQAEVEVEVGRKVQNTDGETGRQTPGRNVISHRDLAYISVSDLVWS